MATRAVEMEVMRDCHVMLVNATKTCYMSLAGDLFRASLITEHIKSAMYLNLTGREKAEELIDCVRSNVGGAPEAIYIFIQVLHRNGLEEVAKILEEKLKQGDTDEEFKLQYGKAMKEGTVSLQTTNSIVMGVAGSGKTRSLAMILDEQLPQQQNSTPLAKAPVLTKITHSWMAIDSNDTKIQQIENDKYFEILMNSIKDKIAEAPTESARPVMQKYIAPNYGREDEDLIVQHGLQIDEFFQQAAKKNETERKELLENLRWNKLSDCGGQPQFLQILPMFIHDISLGIFTIKLNERLDSYPMIQFYEEDKPLGDPYKSLYTHEEILKYCMRTLVSQGTGLCKTKFLFLGTHEDLKHECNESIEEKNIKLNEIVALFNMQENIILSSDCCDLIFPINANIPTSVDWHVMKEVRKAIAENSDVPRIKVPIKWFALEHVLLRYVQKEEKAVLLESTCFKMVNSIFHFDGDGFKAALKYLHRGKFIFHYEKKQLIIAQMQVFLDILTKAVCYNIDMCTNPRRPVAKGFEWRKFKQGILHASCLDKFASEHYIDGVFSRDDLLQMFIDLCILSKLGSDEYLMPCIMPAEEKPFSNPEPETQKVPAMVVEFPDGGPKLGLYCALISYLINIENWVLVMDKIKKPYHLTRNSIHFEAPGDNPGKVTLNDPLSTFFFVTYHGPFSLASKVCPLIRTTILNGIQCVSKTLNYSAIKEDIKPPITFLCPLVRNAVLNGIQCIYKILNYSTIKEGVQLQPQITFLCPCEESLHPAQINGEFLSCPEHRPEYVAVPITAEQKKWLEERREDITPVRKQRVPPHRARGWITTPESGWTVCSCSLVCAVVAGICAVIFLFPLTGTASGWTVCGLVCAIVCAAMVVVWYLLPSTYTGSREYSDGENVRIDQVGYPVLDKNITGQSQLNCMEWRRKNGNKDTLPLKEMMSVKWKKMGQNLKITDAKLKGFDDKHRGDKEECMDSVITEWFKKTSDKYPTTWAGLIKLLESVNLNALVKDILEAAADEESTLYEK